MHTRYPVSNQLCLPSLNVADNVPLYTGQIVQVFNLDQRFFGVVLTETAQSAGVRGAYRSLWLPLGDSHNFHVFRAAARLGRALRDAFADASQPVRDFLN